MPLPWTFQFQYHFVSFRYDNVFDRTGGIFIFRVSSKTGWGNFEDVRIALFCDRNSSLRGKDWQMVRGISEGEQGHYRYVYFENRLPGT